MKILILLFFMLHTLKVAAQVPMQVDFTSDQELTYWYRVNDSVMGGVSESNLRLDANIAYFEGELSLKNNGGFASVRRVGPISFLTNLPIFIHVKGDGRTYQFRLRTNQGFDSAAYVATFATQADEWQTLNFVEADFVAQFRGRVIRGAPALSFSQVKQLGFMLADKQPGKFKLGIKSIGQ